LSRFAFIVQPTFPNPDGRAAGPLSTAFAGAFAGATLVRGAPSTFYNHSRTLQPNGRRKTRLRPPTRNVGLRPGTPSSQAS
jgi:hypothetical protein